MPSYPKRPMVWREATDGKQRLRALVKSTLYSSRRVLEYEEHLRTVNANSTPRASDSTSAGKAETSADGDST